jgi:hypothetical protein
MPNFINITENTLSASSLRELGVNGQKVSEKDSFFI